MGNISNSFLSYAADILGDTATGLSGSEIVKFFRAKSIDYNVEIPHSKTPLSDVANKRTAFLENLEKFSPEQQFYIIAELAEHDRLSHLEGVKKLKQKLHSQYSSLSSKSSIAESELVVEAEHWLEKYPDAHGCYKSGLDKYKARVYERNSLDDFRLSLELLLRHILGNSKSLENQINDLGNYQQKRGMSPEVTNMFVKLVDYYNKYQNTYVKHNDKVNDKEIEFIIDLTTSFMKYLMKA